MKKNSLACLILCLVLVYSLLMPVFAATEAASSETTEPTQGATTAETEPEATAPVLPDASIVNGCRSIEAQVPLYPVEGLSAESLMLYEVNTQTLLCAVSPDMICSPASLVKIMTLLLAVEYGGLDEMVSVTVSSLTGLPETAMSAELKPGERISLENLLYCMMVGSANDAAAVIAEYIAGSQSIFVAKMNRRAQELGCTNTKFTDAHGLDSKQYTTARDICRILEEAMKNEVFMRIFGTTKYTVPATEMTGERKLTTNNYMMITKYTFFDSHVTGGRTGVTDKNGRCLATTAEGNGMKFVAVVLGSTPIYRESDGSVQRYGNYEDTKYLYEKAFTNMRITSVLSENQVLEQYPVANGDNYVAVGADAMVQLVLPTDVSLNEFSIRFMDSVTIEAPVALGQKISSVQLWWENCCVAELDLVARNAVPIASNKLVDTWTEEYQGPDLLMMAIVILVIAAVFILAAGALYVVRWTQIFMMRLQSRRRRRDRRRSR